jgi:phosphatidylserine/phosphatidylglycerophosphate/cardiolipin synthase-like enzyme
VVENGRAALHAKAAIADDHTALVTSANLTGFAIKDNMELGLLIRGGPVPGRLASHLRELIAKQELVETL